MLENNYYFNNTVSNLSAVSEILSNKASIKKLWFAHFTYQAIDCGTSFIVVNLITLI